MTDKRVVLLVTAFLGVVAETALIGTIYLLVHGVGDAALLLAVSTPGSAALGGLTALLVSTHSSPPAPAAAIEASVVPVVNQP